MRTEVDGSMINIKLAIQNETPPPRLVERLSGMPITQHAVRLIDAEISRVEREMISRGFDIQPVANADLLCAELYALKDYRAQAMLALDRVRDKTDWERTHPGVPYPW